MRVIWSIKDAEFCTPSVLTMGIFDGVHTGHQQILNITRERAQKEGAYSVLLTFEPHPGFVLKSDVPDIRLLSTIDEKIEILEDIGLDCLVIANFTQSFATTAAEKYVKDLIVDGMRARQIIIGHDHAFGRGRRGNVDLLARLGKKYGFTVDAVSPVIDSEEQTVSSTRVRELIAARDVETAAILLGRPYSVHGQVINGTGRGNKIGFPTANIRLFSQYKLVPGDGIYATRSRINGVTYASVTYVGTRPTFGLEERVIESHLIDFDKDIYGSEITLYFYKCLRQEQQFKDEQSLAEAIKQDKGKAEKLLQNGGTD